MSPQSFIQYWCSIFWSYDKEAKLIKQCQAENDRIYYCKRRIEITNSLISSTENFLKYTENDITFGEKFAKHQCYTDIKEFHKKIKSYHNRILQHERNLEKYTKELEYIRNMKN